MICNCFGMGSALEKGRNNTAAKQLPSWLHPAVPTIRRYSKMAQQTKGNHPSLYYVPLFSYQAIVIIIGVRTFQLILLYYTYKYRKKQSRKISFSIFDVKKGLLSC